MKIAIKGILVTLAWLGLLIGTHALAQQDGPAEWVDQEAPVESAEQQTAEQDSPATKQPEEVPLGQPESDILAPEPAWLTAESFTSPAGPCDSIGLDGSTCGPCSVGPCCAVCGGGSCCPPLWYIDQDVRVLTLSKPRGIALTKEFVGYGAGGVIVYEPRMGTRSLGFDVAAGYLGTLGRYLGRDSENRDHFLEFTYWGLNDWIESFAVTGTRYNYGNDVNPNWGGTLFSPFDLAVLGFNYADRQSIVYQADINNYELNVRIRPRGRPDRLVLHPNGRWRRECRPGWYTSYLFGLRVFSIDSMFQYASSGVFEGKNLCGDYLSLTHNDLFGLQIGGDYIYRKCKWTWGFRAKAGPFINFCDQKSHVTSYDAGETELDFYRIARKDDAALVIEFGFLTTYKVRPNLTLRAAYDLMWVTGLALAPEQLRFETDPPTGINTNGLAYLHGLSLGLTWTW